LRVRAGTDAERVQNAAAKEGKNVHDYPKRKWPRTVPTAPERRMVQVVM
jgi:hypothetical protein